MSKKIILTIIIICTIICSTKAQIDLKAVYGIKSILSLKVGDQVPDFEIPKLFNSTKKTARSSDFKNQLWIIDFWYRGCSSCIEALPKMQQLQEQFGAKLKILPANYEREEDIIPFWKRNKYTKNLALSTVVDDKILLSYFPYKAAPHEVWIYKGKVIAITTADYVSANNIKKVLSGEVVNWPIKDDFYGFNGDKQPLFVLDPNQINGQNTFVQYAAISDYKPNLGLPFFGKWFGIVKDPDKKTVRTYNVNIDIYNLYYVRWVLAESNSVSTKIKPGSGTANEVVWEVSDKLKYKFYDASGNKEDWLMKNAICFESQYPDTGQTDQEVHKTVISDLNRLLGLNVRWEKRKEKVLVLVRTTKDDKLKSKNEINSTTDFNYKQIGTLHQFRDNNLTNLIGMLNSQELNPYIFDETGYNGKVDMDLDVASWTDIVAVRKAIAPYGLDLKEEERLVDKFVFTEVK